MAQICSSLRCRVGTRVQASLNWSIACIPGISWMWATGVQESGPGHLEAEQESTHLCVSPRDGMGQSLPAYDV